MPFFVGRLDILSGNPNIKNSKSRAELCGHDTFLYGTYTLFLAANLILKCIILASIGGALT